MKKQWKTLRNRGRESGERGEVESSYLFHLTSC